jgi:hypothetical protein
LLLHLIMDRFVSKIPGSPPVKAFGLSLIIAAACAYPVFGGRASETRQGHDLFSQEKPEVIASQEEQKRRQERQGRPQS